MKVDFLFEADVDRIAVMKAAQTKRFSGIRDSLSREDIAHLTRMVKLKRAKKNPRRGVPDESLDTLQGLKLADANGPTPGATPFLQWLADNPNREQDFHDKRADANDSLRRGQLKRDNDHVDPKQKKARKIIKSLSDDEKEVFRKLHNRYLNKRTKNLAKSWGDTPRADIQLMQDKGMIDRLGNLTDTGEFTLNYFTAFKNDPDGLDRVGRERRVGNFGDARKRRTGRLRKAAN